MTWTQSKIEYFKANYYTKTNMKMSETLGISYNTLRAKARELGLVDKRKLGLGRGTPTEDYTRKFIPKEILYYGPGLDTIKESKGKKYTSNMQNLKNILSKGDKIKLKIYYCNKKKKTSIRKFSGIIIQKTDNFIVLQGTNYRECFGYVDLCTNRIVLEEY